MPRKVMTPEEKKAWGQKMAAARAQKKTEPKIDKVAELEQKIAELSQLVANQQPAQPNPTVGVQGFQGTVVKFSSDPKKYPDPTDRLYDHPDFKRFAMRENYHLSWNVLEVPYTAADNVRYSEPRFIVELFRYPSEEEKKLLKLRNKEGGLIRVARHYQHEDEETTRNMARKLGIDMPMKELMDEVRFQRIFTWLRGLPMFFPETVESSRKEVEMVIAGRPVTVVDSESIVSKEAGTAQANALQ